MATPMSSVQPSGYDALLAGLKDRVRDARSTVLGTVNTQLIELYWLIGCEVLQQQSQQG